MFAHLTLLPKDADNYEVRVWDDTPADPLGPIDPATGQPIKRYVEHCVVSVKDGVATVTSILKVPPGAWWALRRALKAKGIKLGAGERWDEHGNKRPVVIPVDPSGVVSSEVSNASPS